MNGLYPENDPWVESRSNDDEQQGAAESNSLFDGLEFDLSTTDVDAILGGVLFNGGTNESDSLFNGDVEMQSLLARLEGEESRQQAHQQQQQHRQQQQGLTFSLAFPPALAFSSLPLSPSVLLQAESAGPFSAVSTLPHDEIYNQPQQQQQQHQESKQEVPVAVPGQGEDVQMSLEDFDFGLDGCPDANLDVNFDVNFDFGLGLDFGLAVEQGVTKQGQSEQETEQAHTSEKEVVTSPSGCQNLLTTTTTTTATTPLHATSIDNPSSTTDTGARGDQEGPGPTIINISDDDDSDDDVVLLSSRQINGQVVQGFVSAPPQPPSPTSLPGPLPHHLELRPRCPQGPPPARIDLDSFNVEELLPFVQLQAKLSLEAVQERLGLNADAWKTVLSLCRGHLANPAHAITLSGSNPVALRALKVTLIHSALALLKDSDGRAGVGRFFFGRESALDPKSEHVWPEDSTTLTLFFIQLFYRLTRNLSSRNRYRKVNVAPPYPTSGEQNHSKATELSTSPEEDQLQSSSEAPTETRPRKRKRKATQPRPAPKPAEPPVQMATAVQVQPRTSLSLRYSSPSVLREALLATTTSGSIASVSESEKTLSPTLTAPSPTTAFAEQAHNNYHTVRRAPADASIRYRVNVVEARSQKRAIPQIRLGHEGDIRGAGYSYLTGLCNRLGRTVDCVSIMTILGLERVTSDLDWDRAINRVHEDELMMDDEVKILVRLLD